MMIAKVARDCTNFRRRMQAYPSARIAFESYLLSLCIGQSEVVLLPAFIGWSNREGSGVFDPIEKLGLAFEFYALNENLAIDLESMRRSLEGGKVKLVVLIHYFGYVDPNYVEAVALAREFGALVLEDEAHALFSDLIGGVCGRRGDAAIFSLHKMLPVNGGGVLCHNDSDYYIENDAGTSLQCLTQFDLYSIASRRIENAICLQSLLVGLDEIVIMRPTLDRGVVPQTFPILIKNVSRDRLYDMMNDSGYGVVSLYHTMIDKIDVTRFPYSSVLAAKILNLPVHQDIEVFHLKGLVDCLKSCIVKLKG